MVERAGAHAARPSQPRRTKRRERSAQASPTNATLARCIQVCGEDALASDTLPLLLAASPEELLDMVAPEDAEPPATWSLKARTQRRCVNLGG